jgi:hypothetical protein
VWRRRRILASTRSELKGRGGLPFELEQTVCQGEIGTGISGAREFLFFSMMQARK